MRTFWGLLAAGVAGSVSLAVLVGLLLLVGLLAPQPTLNADSAPLIYRLDGAIATTEGTQVTLTRNAESLCLPDGSQVTCFGMARLRDVLGLANEAPVDVCRLLGECP